MTKIIILNLLANQPMPPKPNSSINQSNNAKCLKQKYSSFNGGFGSSSYYTSQPHKITLVPF